MNISVCFVSVFKTRICNKICTIMTEKIVFQGKLKPMLTLQPFLYERPFYIAYPNFFYFIVCLLTVFVFKIKKDIGIHLAIGKIDLKNCYYHSL